MCSPTLAVTAVATIGSAAVLFAQQSRQAANARTVANAKAQQQRNRVIAANQDIAADQEREQIRQELIGEDGQIRAGQINVALAANGVVLGGADSTASRLQGELAGEVAFRKLVSDDERKLRERNLLIEAQDAQFQAGLFDFEAASSRGPSVLGAVLKTGASLAGSFKGTGAETSFDNLFSSSSSGGGGGGGAGVGAYGWPST
jgi:hypothetical protein